MSHEVEYYHEFSDMPLHMTTQTYRTWTQTKAAVRSALALGYECHVDGDIVTSRADLAMIGA